jgi:hypothetical protein
VSERAIPEEVVSSKGLEKVAYIIPSFCLLSTRHLKEYAVSDPLAFVITSHGSVERLADVNTTLEKRRKAFIFNPTVKTRKRKKELEI